LLPDLKEFFVKLERAAKEVGLEVSEGKTNYLVVYAQHTQARTLRSVITISSVLVPTIIWENL
jgi:hypothetical protein